MQREARHLGLNFVGTIYNGIPIREFPLNLEPENSLLFIGRLIESKGAATAIEVAKRTETPLVLIGQPRPGKKNEEYYQRLKPFLDHPLITHQEFVPSVKIPTHYQRARVLLFPIEWEEPFGLVVIEANACGTPVVAFARGAMPELIKNGVNGFLIKPGDIDGMVEAVKRIYAMPEDEYQKMRKNCRKHVEENFTVEKMVDGYEKVYRKVIEEWKTKKRT